MENVFVSHSSRDRAKTLQLVAALERHGHKVWWDVHLEGGQVFKSVIEEKLSEVDVVVVLWSKAANASDWVNEEARVSGSRLLPVRYNRRLQPPDEFGAIHAEDLSQWDGTTYDAEEIKTLSKRICELKSHLDREKVSAKLKLTPKQQSLVEVLFDSAMPGGLRVARFVLGATASGVGLWILLFAVNLLVGAPETTPGLLWLVLLLLGMGGARAVDQMIAVAKRDVGIRFYSSSFSFSCTVCGLAGIVIALAFVLQTHLAGAASVEDASGTLQFALGAGLVLLVASYAARLMITVTKVLQSRASDTSAG
jgi:hypothetical protein